MATKGEVLLPEAVLGREAAGAVAALVAAGWEVRTRAVGESPADRPQRVIQWRPLGPGKVEVWLAPEAPLFEEDRTGTRVSGSTVPRHIAIIMDGNGRWATARGLPRLAGHAAGVGALKRTVTACSDAGVKILTAYAFSTENWRRPRTEVDGLMNLLVESLARELDDLRRQGVRLRAIGALEGLPKAVQRTLAHAEANTADNQGLELILALNYGSRREILLATQALAREVQAGRLNPEEITEEELSRHLYTSGVPDPDLVIRPSGEKRLSNFLLWQAAYSEIWYTDVLWPDFDAAVLAEALNEYQRRERRFGGVGRAPASS